MNLERWIKRTIEIQGIAAPTFFEGERATFMEAEFRLAGLQLVRRDSTGNVIGCLPGAGAPTVLLCAHLDTVFPPDTELTCRREENTLHGQGIGDNSVALASLLEFAEDLKQVNRDGDIWFVATVGEEGLGNLKGMRRIVDHFGDKISAYIVLEGMSLGTIYHRALPVRRYRIEINTAGGHSWVHSDRPSAIHELVHLSDKLLSIPIPEKPRTSFNIGKVKGGISINTVADHAELEIDLRSEDAKTLSRIARKIKPIVSSARKHGVDILLESIGDRPGGSIPVNHPLVRIARRALARNKIEPVYLQAGSTDANIPLSLGYPAVCVGLTYGGGAHSADEFIQIEPMSRGYLSVLELVQSALQLHSNP